VGLFDKARERRAAAEARATQERQVAETRARQAAAARAVQDKLAAEAMTELGKLSSQQGRDRRSLLAWESAQSRLRSGTCSSERAATSAFFAKRRIEALQISEPPPVLAEFVPAVTPPPERAVTALAAATQRFQVAVDAHAELEQMRLQELRYTQNLYEQLLATERADSLQRQAEMWPRGVALEPEIASICGIEDQVKAQNAKIDRQIHKLCHLLTEGLDALPATAVAATNERGQGEPLDARDVVLGLEAALTAMPLEPDLTRLRVAYSPESHQAVIEYELPEVNVVPTTKIYRYVKSRNTVVETARPQSQVKRYTPERSHSSPCCVWPLSSRATNTVRSTSPCSTAW
jgi:restriction system protein